MALLSTLGSPGIEIREVDNSFRLDSSTATTVYIPGFAAQGPVDEVMSIGSIADFETIYGTPTNAAERYFYYTVKAVLDGAGQGVTVLCSRLPYGSDLGDTVSNAYTLMAYPAIPVVKKNYKIGDLDINGNLITDDEGKIKTKIHRFDLPQFIAGEWKEDNTILAKTATDKIAHNFKIEIGNKSPKLSPKINYSFFVDEDSSISGINNLKLSLPESTSISYVAPVGAKIRDLTDTTSEEKYSLKLDIRGTKTSEGETTQWKGYTDGYLTRESKGNQLIIHYTSNVYDDNETSPINVGAFVADFIFKLSDIDSANSLDEDEIGIKISKNTDSQGIINLIKVESHAVAETLTGKTGKLDGAEHDDVTYLIGSPTTFQISLGEYYKIVTGESLKWSDEKYSFASFTKDDDGTVSMDDEEKSKRFGLFSAIGHSAFITINTSRSIVNNNFEGYYVGLTDNMFINPSDDYTFNAVEKVKITTKTQGQGSEVGLMDSEDDLSDYQTLSGSRLSFYLDSNYQGSISRVLARNITSMDISGTEYDDTISLGLFKLAKSGTTSDILKLNYSLREKYNWSFGKTRVKSSINSTSPVSYFAENIMEGSSNISIIINPYIADKAFVDVEGKIHGKIRVYGKKLIDNLDKYEQKYLLKNFITTSASLTNSANTDALSAIVPVKVAESSLKSWTSMIQQAGITPEFIKNELSSTEYINFQPINSLLPFGTYTTPSSSSKLIGTLAGKLERALELVENDEEYPDIDIVLESGLGTIAMNTCTASLAAEAGAKSRILDESTTKTINGEDNNKYEIFDETVVLQGVEDMRTGRSSLSEQADEVIEAYRSVQSVFTNFANSMQNGGRGDCFYISDVPRGILIKGKNTKVTNLFGTQIESNAYEFGETINHSFSTSIYYPIKHTFDTIVSSYMSTYAQWVKILDKFSGEKIWLPVSGYIAANMASTDAVHGTWYAAAGLRRGVINGVLDYALSPNVSQRTDLYKLCINSVPKIPNYGVTIWGIRTMSKASSAFDQNTCRRTFLYIEKKVKQALRYYIFEPNTSYTRLQIINDIDPFLEKVKNAGGIYNYVLTCDTTNNTPEVINNGDLAVSIAAAPTRTAENIVVEFTANKYSEEVSSSESIM